MVGFVERLEHLQVHTNQTAACTVLTQTLEMIVFLISTQGHCAVLKVAHKQKEKKRSSEPSCGGTGANLLKLVSDVLLFKPMCTFDKLDCLMFLVAVLCECVHF
ncbi:hypothetical protein CHARACLAT_017499 [Characodon lateralis]|uniref:Uncharacterized protein n=1 Tax=Characodon lateralis TaxID=208331 RepID=A0ABU7CS59_9TELE|nr:hypothetical protein [Characodon lateralis]